MSENKEITWYFIANKIISSIINHKRWFVILIPLTTIYFGVYFFSQPDVYSCTVKISPESNKYSKIEYVDIKTKDIFVINTLSDKWALYPKIYPRLMNSIDFRLSLLPIKVKMNNDSLEYTYYDYILNHRKKTWWSNILGKDERKDVEEINPFKLTMRQDRLMDYIRGHIRTEMDEKTRVISITVKDQDALVCAILADSVTNRLQQFLTDYHTKKAMMDFIYNSKLQDEARDNLIKARNDYSFFSDSNRDLKKKQLLLQLEDLENEMNLRNIVYSHFSTMSQEAKNLIQEETPSFATIQSSTVPVSPDGVSPIVMTISYVLLTFIFLSFFFFLKEGGFYYIVDSKGLDL